MRGRDTPGPKFGNPAGSGRPVTIECDCGVDLDCDSASDRVACRCGSQYVVTVTKLVATDDR